MQTTEQKIKTILIPVFYDMMHPFSGYTTSRKMEIAFETYEDMNSNEGAVLRAKVNPVFKLIIEVCKKTTLERDE